MKTHLKYLRYVIRHKWFVYRAGRDLGVARWQLLVHDWTKFLPCEWAAYVAYFNKHPQRDGKPPEVVAAFARAWRHHQRVQPHHWQFWLLTWDHGGTDALPMPERYVREMVADWRGAGAALGFPDTRGWYEKNRGRIILHEDTRAAVEALLA